jgi:predicted ATPase
MWQRCVITGGVGSGKTSLVHALKKYPHIWIVNEEATPIIQHQIKIKGNLLPWVNPMEFAKEVTNNAV